jgi:diacylglycerol kinase family enzyme
MNPSPPHRPWVLGLTRFGKDLSQWAQVTPQHPLHTETLLDWALKVNVDRLVVWGGDGTFHRVVRGLWQRDALDKMELALVPVGTCNDLARRYGLSRECWGRWEAAVPTGRLARLTLGRVAWKASPRVPVFEGEDVFINNAGFGRPRPSAVKKDPAWRVLLSMKPIGVSGRWDAGRFEGNYFMALAALAPYFSGGLHFEPDLSPEEGILRLYLVPARNKWRLAARLARGRFGYALFDNKITKITAKKIVLETTIPVWPQGDGEPPLPKPARYVEFEALPQTVKLWVPH